LTAAGASTGGTVDAIDEEAWDRTFAINVKGTYLWIHYAIAHMIAARKGSIVTIGSQLAQASPGKNAAYVASKGAIASFTKTMAVDHAKQGIRVNAVFPGPIWGANLRGYLDAQADARGVAAQAVYDEFAAKNAMHALVLPDEIADSVVFLASDMARPITGQALYANAGESFH